MHRPSFPLDIQAKIERAREEVFESASSRFDMLFFPMVPGALLGGWATAKNVPIQRKPANLKIQLAAYTSTLFDAEASHYLDLKPTSEQLSLWLGDLVERTNTEVRSVAADERHNYHCGLQDRLIVVTETLAARAQSWLKAKQKADSKPTSSHAPRPIRPVIPMIGLPRLPEPPPAIQAVEESPKIKSSEAAGSDAKSIEKERRAVLLLDYKKACGNPADYKIYNARNSGIHKPQFYAWKKGDLPSSSQTSINFENFLRAKKAPIPRKPKE